MGIILGIGGNSLTLFKSNTKTMSSYEKSAFPILKDQFNVPEIGINKLEYFTAAALQGILANADVMREATRKFESANRGATDPIEFGEAIGRLAILYAKGALNELERL